MLMDCRVFWVPDHFTEHGGGVFELPDAGALIKEWVRKGYEVKSVVPGMGPGNSSGLFITMRR